MRTGRCASRWNARIPTESCKAAAQPPVPVRVDSQKVADGVWYLTGGTHHSVLVEFKDYVAVVEGPLNDERAVAVIEATRKLAAEQAYPLRHQHTSSFRSLGWAARVRCRGRDRADADAQQTVL